MTLDQLDQFLAEWRGKLDAAAQSLVDVRSHPTYLQLASRSDLTGVTLARVEPMLASMVSLFDYYERLQTCMGRAEEARKDITRLFTSPEKIDQVERFLTKPNNGNSETPADLLAKLEEGLSAAKYVVLNVDAAWRQLTSQFDAVEHEVQGLDARIAQVRKLIDQDPLGAQVEAAELRQLAARRMALKQQMNNAAQLLAQLIAARDRADQSFTEANTKIQNANLRPPCAPQTVSSLDQWLRTLNAKLDEGSWDAVAVGVERWRESAKRCLQSEMDAAEHNQQPVLQRRELRGRLDALKAKAVAKGKSEDADLSKLGNQARTLLQTNPTSLDQAIQIVQEYEKRLSLLLCQ